LPDERHDQYDYIIVGSGIAGLYAAILAHRHGSVLVLTKGNIDDSNTRWAQGGIAASVGPEDSPESHLADTIAAGAGLVDEDAARVLTGEASSRIRDLVALGVEFDTLHGEVALALEGAHSRPRVLHAGGDQTGARIELTLSSVARLEGITVLEQTIATGVLLEDGAAIGIGALDAATGERTEYHGRFVVLATGGAGQMYRATTNPAVATGDGIALAYRAGAEVQDMEFIQFHPTALRVAGAPSFLISEAVRGEGGRLLDAAGVPFMTEYDSRAELAPRDIVARAIVDRMNKTGADHVLLDIPPSPRSTAPASTPGSTSHATASPFLPPPTTPSAAFAPTPGAQQRSPGSTPAVSVHASAFTAPTALPRTPSSRPWSSPSAWSSARPTRPAIPRRGHRPSVTSMPNDA
jgi:L-aspartate oxidase